MKIFDRKTRSPPECSCGDQRIFRLHCHFDDSPANSKRTFWDLCCQPMWQHGFRLNCTWTVTFYIRKGNKDTNKTQWRNKGNVRIKKILYLNILPILYALCWNCKCLWEFSLPLIVQNLLLSYIQRMLYLCVKQNLFIFSQTVCSPQQEPRNADTL